MLCIARRSRQAAGRTADLARADMKSLHVDRDFDAVLCLGTAFNYLDAPGDARKALQRFRRQLRAGGLLALDVTNFDAWIRNPQNARTEVDYRSPGGTRVAIFAFNEQDLTRSIHKARFITAIQKDGRIEIAFDEASLRIWMR